MRAYLGLLLFASCGGIAVVDRNDGGDGGDGGAPSGIGGSTSSATSATISASSASTSGSGGTPFVGECDDDFEECCETFEQLCGSFGCPTDNGQGPLDDGCVATLTEFYACAFVVDPMALCFETPPIDCESCVAEQEAVLASCSLKVLCAM